MSQIVRFFTKKLLAKANAIAVKRGYNRALSDGFVLQLPDTLKFPIIHHESHSHKNGSSCEPHVRACFAYVDDEKEIATLDCDWNLFYALPSAQLG
jgi:hypothetical protein